MSFCTELLEDKFLGRNYQEGSKNAEAPCPQIRYEDSAFKVIQEG